MDPIARLQGIESPESVLIPTKDDLEVTPIAGGCVHVEKSAPLQSLIPGDPIILKPSDNPMTVGLRVPCDFGLLILQRLFLLVGGSSQIADCRDERFSIRFGGSHGSPFPCKGCCG
jgi:hypothetical protein